MKITSEYYKKDGGFMSQSALPRRCHICGGTDCKGVTLVRGFICAACLAKISATDVTDARYAFYIQKLKQLWRVS